MHILTKNKLIKMQEQWESDDAAKFLDFTNYNYWLIMGPGIEPLGFETEQEAKKYIAQHK